MDKYPFIAQICLNGHLITNNINLTYQTEKYCHICGAETISSCLECHTPLKAVPCTKNQTTSVPAFCYICGNPFPWTEDALESARILIDEEEVLSADDREKLKMSLPDLLAETPKTSLAVTRFKRAVACVGSITKEALMKFAVSMACDAAKSQLGL